MNDVRSLEVCCADLASVKAAYEGGADRVELCARLDLDGLTPSRDLLHEALLNGIRVHVLIRPREGNFVYSEFEVQQMIDDIKMARQEGAHGVVIGALTPLGDIDVPVCQRLIDEAEDLSITFHRAFDVCRNPQAALEQIISLGCHRLLTSGQHPTALEGASLIKELVQQAGNRLVIMAGSGLTPDNAAELVRQTGVSEVHGSLRSVVDGIKVTTKENVTRVKSYLSFN